MVHQSRSNPYACALIFLVLAHYSTDSAAFGFVELIYNGKILEVYPTSIGMGGEIVVGDYAKMVSYIAERGEFPDTVYLTGSPGGDLQEAMKIGRLFRKSLTNVYLDEGRSCISACFFILVGSPDRQIRGGTIGIHRPYFDASLFRELNLEEAERQYAELDDIARAYLMEMDVPNHIIEQMFAIPSGEMERVSNRDVYRYIDGRTPAYGEWLTAKCGDITREEMKIQGRVYRGTMESVIGLCELYEITEEQEDAYSKLISRW